MRAGGIIPGKLSTGGPVWDASGNLTATSFVGPVTGAVTGNVTGNVTGSGNSTFAGNVGIGTSSPMAKLAVSGGEITLAQTAGQSTGPAITLNNTANSGGLNWFILSSGSGNGSGAGNLEIGNNTTTGNVIYYRPINANGNPITNSPTTAKAWVNFSGLTAGTFAGGTSTVSRTSGSTTATVTTTTAHGLITGNLVWVLTGVVAGVYGVTVLTGTTFTITTAATTALSSVSITFQVSSIRSSYNVSSVTKASAGAYRVNFLSAIAAGYSVSGIASNDSTNTCWLELNEIAAAGGAPTTTSVGVRAVALVSSSALAQDSGQVSVTIFGN
jgi:hypothetical protein